jgi:hypothetical protein
MSIITMLYCIRHSQTKMYVTHDAHLAALFPFRTQNNRQSLNLSVPPIPDMCTYDFLGNEPQLHVKRQ